MRWFDTVKNDVMMFRVKKKLEAKQLREIYAEPFQGKLKYAGLWELLKMFQNSKIFF